MIEIVLLMAFIGLGVVWWLLERRHDKTYTEILITYPFDSLKKGKIAVFKSNIIVEVGDYVLIRLPGYDMIWKVISKEGEKVELINRKNEKLTGFPVHHLWGKMIGYKGELC